MHLTSVCVWGGGEEGLMPVLAVIKKKMALASLDVFKQVTHYFFSYKNVWMNFGA